MEFWRIPRPARRHLAACLIAVGLAGCKGEPATVSEPVPPEKPRATEVNLAQSTEEPPVDVESVDLVDGDPENVDQSRGERQQTTITEAVRPAPAQYRPTYQRRKISEDQLRQAGLTRHRAGHVDLITDVTPDKYEPLLPLPEAIFPVWEEYFGRLPDAEDGAEYRVTGFLMRDRESFLEAGLMSGSTLLSYHGRQIGGEFWLNDQSWDYYRGHLFLHEATHAFMRHLPGEAVDLPLWYLEGMAEMLSTHRLNEDGSVDFNVMPVDRSRFVGLERIAIVQRDVEAHGVRPISAITVFNAEDFTKVESYAWCWALCRFLDSHPRYRDRFRKTARELITVPFRRNMAALFESDEHELETEWLLFAANIEHGFDFKRARIDFRSGRESSGSQQVEVLSDRGWQSSELLVKAGKQYRVTSTGQFTLANQPRPWISEANGVSIRYTRGRPLGQLQAAVLAPAKEGGTPGASMLREYALGNDVVFQPADSGTLFLRVNDAWGELADNRGSLLVTVEAITVPLDLPIP